MEGIGTTKEMDFNLQRKKRVKHLKTWIVVIVLFFLMVPTILCIILFFKINNLQKQIDILMMDHYGTTLGEKGGLIGEVIANGIEFEVSDKDKNSQYKYYYEKRLYLKIEDYASSLEELKKTEYNDMGKSTVDINSKEETDISDENITVISSVMGSKENKEVEALHTSVTITDNNQQKPVDEIEEYKEFKDKEVYLTFDDGPSKYTEEILDILAKYDVKATFFVVGKTDEYSKTMYKKIIEQGHSLGLHSFTHDYNKIYNSVEDFDKDFTKLRNLLYDTTGYFSDIYRFPGGSGNEVSEEDISVFINYLNEKSIAYFDWNVVNGDATGIKLTPQKLCDNVINGVRLHKKSIVLMHDTDSKKNTVDSLDQLLKRLTDYGAIILPLNEKVTPIQQVKASSLK